MCFGYSKNRLNETVLLSTRHILTGHRWIRKRSKFQIQLSGSMSFFQDQPFSVIMAELARTEDVDCCHVMMVHRDKTLRPTDTPATIRLNTADIISKCTLGRSRGGTRGPDPPWKITKI